MTTLTRRADFLAANRGKRAPTPGFVLLVRPRGDEDGTMRIGFTVTKKIGGAVVRNRMKRRFRALARELLPEAGVAGADHVLIGRSGGVERDFALLRDDLRQALGKIGKSTVRPEPVEGLPYSSVRSDKQDRASTGPARTDAGDDAGSGSPQ